MASEEKSDAPEENFDALFNFKGGDITLIAIYKGKRTIGKVASQSMVLASPVWTKFIFPPWEVDDQKSSSTDSKQIDCSEDNGEALLILLRIAHLQFNDSLETICFEDLSNLAILCELYDCHQLISPWSNMWIEKHRGARPSRADPDHRWLYIAWSFGKKDIFEQVTIDMVKSVHYIGDEVMSAGEVVCEPTPERILEHILESRFATISSLLDIAYQYLDRFGKGTTICTRNNAGCDAIIYGGLVLQLISHGLWPRIDALSCHSSVNSLATLINSLTVQCLPDDGYNGGYGRSYGGGYNNTHHQACAPVVFKTAVDGITSKIPPSALSCHTIHMDSRSKANYQRK